MTDQDEDELAVLNQAIGGRQRYIEDQTILVEVLEQDGHDVVAQEIELKKERSELAKQIVRQFELLLKTTIPAP